MVTPHLPWKFHANRSSGLKKLASRHRAVSPTWPKIESDRPMVTPHLPWKFHANRSSRFLVILLTKKQRCKQRNWSKTLPRRWYYRGSWYYRGGVKIRCQAVFTCLAYVESKDIYLARFQWKCWIADLPELELKSSTIVDFIVICLMWRT